MNKLKELRLLMEKENIDYFYIPTSDFHESEYTGNYFKVRSLISGFTGSAGVLLVSKNEAFLWTDGRYFLQASMQLKDSGIKLMKMGIDISLVEYIKNIADKNKVFAFDFRCVSYKMGDFFSKLFISKNIHLQNYSDFRICDLPKEKAFLVEEKYSGESTISRINKIRKEIIKRNAKYHVLNTLDDINYIFNIRGNDIEYTPYIMSYAIISLDEAILYLDKSKLNKEINDYFIKNNVTVKEYFDVYKDVRTLEGKSMVDLSVINYDLASNLDIVSIEINPSQLMKAVKNQVELKHNNDIHILDGLAVFKLMYYLKNNYKNYNISELDIEDMVLKYRQESNRFIEPSFDSIVGFKEHGAIIHYKATKESNKLIDSDGLLLVDSGGQYFGGTTDITRTFALGEISEVERDSFTRVVKGVINLARVKFLYGCNGSNLDVLARSAIWENDIDYRTGTGHGVSYMGGVHEGPNYISWQKRRDIDWKIEEGMVFSDEPGVYIDNQYGIRIENEMVALNGNKNEYGQFMYFDTITYCPIDLDAININMLTFEEKKWLNNYHKKIYDNLKDLVDKEMLAYLKIATREI